MCDLRIFVLPFVRWMNENYDYVYLTLCEFVNARHLVVKNKVHVKKICDH